ncbi:MAG: hypothetical protein RIQ52_351 [Pseudomonadota bacterium]
MTTSERRRLIALDLDGTLVDSAPDLARSVDALLQHLGKQPVGLAQVHRWIGNGSPMLVRRAMTGEMWPDVDPEGHAEAVEWFHDYYLAHMADTSTLFPGVREGLLMLREAGYLLACVTNKSRPFCAPLLSTLGILDLLDAVACAEDFKRLKPDPEPLLATAARFGVSPQDCVMVGDSENDVAAARAAGFRIVCVPYGYRRCELATELGADAVIDGLDALPAWLAAHP